MHLQISQHFRFVQNLGRNPTPLLLLVETCRMFKSFVTESEIEDGKKQKQEGAYSNVISSTLPDIYALYKLPGLGATVVCICRGCAGCCCPSNFRVIVAAYARTLCAPTLYIHAWILRSKSLYVRVRVRVRKQYQGNDQQCCFSSPPPLPPTLALFLLYIYTRMGKDAYRGPADD